MLYNMTHIHYYWWIKYWRFSNKIANCQSLLLANISSYTVFKVTYAFLFGVVINHRVLAIRKHDQEQGLEPYTHKNSKQLTAQTHSFDDITIKRNFFNSTLTWKSAKLLPSNTSKTQTSQHKHNKEFKIPYTGNIWQEKFWQTMQVKAITKEKFGEYATVSAYAIYIFHVSEYWWGKFWRMAHDSPIFPVP